MAGSIVERITKPNERTPVLGNDEKIVLRVQRSGLWYWVVGSIATTFLLFMALSMVGSDDPATPQNEAEGVGGLFVLALLPLAWAYWKNRRLGSWLITDRRLIKRGRRREESIDLRNIATVSRTRRFFSWDVKLTFDNNTKDRSITKVKNSAETTATLIELSRKAHHAPPPNVTVNVATAAIAANGGSALDALKLRFARGEITEEEYQRQRRLLE